MAKASPDDGSFWIGVGIGMGVNVLVALVGLLTRSPILHLAIGLAQILWMIPLCLVAFVCRYTQVGLGLLAAMGFTFMLWLGICGVVVATH